MPSRAFLAHTDDFVVYFGAEELLVLLHRVNRFSQLFEAGNLVDKSVCITAHGDFHRLWGCLACEYENLDLRELALEQMQDFEAIDLWKLDIDDDKVRREFEALFDAFAAVACHAEHFKLRESRGKEGCEEVSKDFFVFDDINSFHGDAVDCGV